MTIKRLTQRNKEEIQQWEYCGEYSAFNYALKQDGWIDKYCCDENHYCYGVEDNDALIGLFLFIEKYNNEFRVLINPEYLSKGYGKLITNAALKMAFEELKFTEISLIVRQNHTVAIKLYEKLGFVRVGETTQMVNGEDVDFYEMLKSKTL